MALLSVWHWRIEELSIHLMSRMDQPETSFCCQHETTNNNLCRLSIQPAFCRTTIAQGGQGSSVSAASTTTNSNPPLAPPVPKLSKAPKDLYLLWNEWTHRLNGSPPAKNFTMLQRGANKVAFCRRKPFWDVVSRLVREGVDAFVAIDRVYNTYGRNRSVSSILKSMRNDAKLPGGAHPSLL